MTVCRRPPSAAVGGAYEGSIRVPNDPILVGAPIIAQWISTDALRLVLGN